MAGIRVKECVSTRGDLTGVCVEPNGVQRRVFAPKGIRICCLVLFLRREGDLVLLCELLGVGPGWSVDGEFGRVLKAIIHSPYACREVKMLQIPDNRSFS